MKILVTGGGGQLAQDCRDVLSRDHQPVLLNRQEFDITQPTQIKAVMADLQPALVLNCAAFTKVDACESDRELAEQTNARGPAYLAEACLRHKCRLIHISTDYVFDGKKSPPVPYVESDPTEPISVYGITKLAGEKAIQNKMKDYAIVRTAWLYGIHGPNFLKTMLRLALSGKAIKVVNDQFGSLTWTYRLAEQLARLIQTPEARGVYHATAEGYGSWFEVTRHLFELLEIKAKLSPCSSEEYPTLAKRPENSILENQHLKKQNFCLMRSWEQDLAQFVSQYREKLISEARGEL